MKLSITRSEFTTLELILAHAVDTGHLPAGVSREDASNLLAIAQDTALAADDAADRDADTLPGEDMDGDFDSAMASAGFGTDEDYGYFGDD